MNPLPVNSRRYAAGLHADGPIAVEFDFVGPVRAIRQLRNQGAFHWLDEFGFCSWQEIPLAQA